MLSRFTKPSFRRDYFSVAFLDRDQRMVKMRVYRRRWLAIGPGMINWAGVILIDGRCTLEIQGPDPDALTHCLVREAWNGDHSTAQEPRRAVIAD